MTIKRAWCFSVALLSFGCGGSQVVNAPAGTPEAQVGVCKHLRSKKTTWAAITKGAGFLAGAGGVGTIAASNSDNKAVVVTTGIVGLVAGATAIVASVVQDDAVAEFTHEKCEQ